MTSKKRKDFALNSVSYFFLIIMCLLVILPLAWMVITSLKSMEEITLTTGTKYLPEKLRWENFINIWKNYPMLDYLKNSLISVGGSTILVIIFSTLCGYGVARFDFVGKKFLLGFLLVTQMFPAVMKIVPYYQILKTLDLINKQTGLIIVYTSFCIPFCTWLMYGFFKRIPKDLDEAARIDGCGWFRTFSKVVLPLTLPGIIATTIYAFLQNWNEYMFASILMTGEANKTLTVGIGQMVGYYRIMWNDLMCGAILSSVPTLLLFIFLQKYLISGMTAGAVKE